MQEVQVIVVSVFIDLILVAAGSSTVIFCLARSRDLEFFECPSLKIKNRENFSNKKR